MPASDVRTILLRALFEPEFHNQLATAPDKAFHGYSLTDEEKAALANPGPELYRFIQPSDEPRAMVFAAPPPTTTTTTTTTVVAVIAVVAIVVFTTAVAPVSPQDSGSVEKYRPLLNAIHNASGATRLDLVKTLISEMMRV